MPETIERFAAAILHDPVRLRIAPVKETSELVEHSVFFVPQKQKTQLLANLLKTRSVTRALVFTRTKHGADRVARDLNRSGIRADAIHGNKSQGARQRSLADFKSSRTHVLVATDVASRGIDVDGISHVMNYDLPVEPETYIHRTGRTGRAGSAGIAVSLCDIGERKHLKAIERLIRQTLLVNKDIPLGAPHIHPAQTPSPPKNSHRKSSSRRRPISSFNR
jgi:ATP-dependent RNA helicase RhlE